jgi:hypothetical protein
MATIDAAILAMPLPGCKVQKAVPGAVVPQNL